MCHRDTKKLDKKNKMIYNKYRIKPILKGIQMQEFEIIFYDKEDGTEPAKEFLLSLDIKMRAKMLRTIEMLQHNGYELREPYSKPIGDGILELRAKVGSNISRVMDFFVVGRKAILTNGFVKKTQKTPKEEIELAKTYRSNYLKRTQKGE